jgi:hypothetical protein
MLNREQFLETLNQACAALGFLKSNVIISHGGASLLHGLRDETDDIDVAIPRHHLNTLLGLGLGSQTIHPFPIPAFETAHACAKTGQGALYTVGRDTYPH